MTLVHAQDGVDGAFGGAGDVAGHVGHRQQVLVVEAVRLRARLFARQLADGDEVRPEPQLAHRGQRSLSRARQPQHDRHVLARLRIVQQADACAPSVAMLDGRRHVRRRRRRRRWRASRRRPATSSAAATRRTSRRRRRRRLLEHGLHLAGELEAARRIGTVDFRDQRLQHRRPRRHLRHLNRGVEPSRDRQRAARARAWRSSWLCSPRSSLGSEVHLQVGEVRPAAEEVVPHQAVEVVRRRRCRRSSAR